MKVQKVPVLYRIDLGSTLSTNRSESLIQFVVSNPAN